MKMIVSFLLLATTAIAAEVNFSGTWVLNVTKSKNLGMMAAMQLTETVRQDGAVLTINDAGTMNGQTQTNEIHYDLNGKAMSNQNVMGQNNQTASKWDGARLVTTWTGEGPIAGTKVVRTETRSLSADGKTMTVQTSRDNTPPIVMVFDKK
jgi:hypothetical protein